MANKVAYIIQLQERFSSKARRIQSATRSMSEGFDKAQRKARALSSRLNALGKSARETGGKIAGFGRAMTTGVTLPLAALGTASLIQSAKLETLATSFETMTGSAEKGRALMEQITRFTATTPFQLEGVARATKTLLAFRVPLEEMPGTLRMLGDVAAGADVPLSDIAQIFGKARAKGKLMTEEILQLAERGIPIIDVLSEKFGITKQQVFEMASKSQISFRAMQIAMADMTAEGGIFFNQTQRQATTLGGLWSTLKDNIALTTAVIGDVIVSVFGLKNGISDLSAFFGDLRDKIRRFAAEHPGLTKFIVIFTAIIAIMGPIIFFVGQAVIGFAALSAVAAVLGTTVAAITLPILAVVAAVGLLIAAGFLLIKNWEGVKGGAILIWNQIKDGIIGIWDGLIDGAVKVGQAILDKIMTPFRKAKEMIEGGISFFLGGEDPAETARTARGLGARMSGSPIQFGGADSPPIVQRSQADVNINLRAPDRTVESVTRRNRRRARGMNIGVNMEPVNG